METIKSYTDISQSKKLAEILPLESADMKFYYNHMICDYEESPYVGSRNYDECSAIPCWSLASLLEQLPKRLEIEDNVYELSIYLYGLYYWNINNGNLCFESKDKDNLVDACVAMIEKLNELDLL